MKAIRAPERLASRLSGSFVLLFVLIFSGVVAVTLYYAQRTFQTSIDDNLQGLAETIDQRLAQPGAESAHVVDELSSAAQFIQLVDADGQVTNLSSNLLAVPLPTFLRRSPTERTVFHTFKSRNTRLREIRYPRLDDSGAVTGYVIVASPIPEVDDAIQSLGVIIVVAGVLGMTFAVIGTVWISLREARPLRELAEQVQETSASNFEERVPRSNEGSAETRQLREAFANLVDRQREVLSRERAFFADSSHVLRTPLAVLQGDIEQLEQGVYGKERQEVVAQARSSIGAMSRAVNGLLLLAREHEAAPGSSWEVIDLSALLDQQVAAARVAAPQLAVTSGIVPGVELAGDRHQLQDLFASLIENACRYTPEGGSVHVTLERLEDGDDACIEIRDTGIGLSQEEASHATERFFRGATARRMFPGGSGLGLAIADRIARLHGGRLTLEPGAEGGAVARVTLPLLG